MKKQTVFSSTSSLLSPTSYLKAKFTLIELLVVIAVIAILAGLLLPALGNAKRMGTKVTCSNQLRQLHTGHTSYMTTYDGYPIVECNMAASDGIKYWYYYLGPEIGMNYFDNNWYAVPRYNKSEAGKPVSTFLCPNGIWLMKSSVSGKPMDEQFYGNRGYNWRVRSIGYKTSGSYQEDLVKWGKGRTIKRPSALAYLHDSSDAGKGSYSTATPPSNVANYQEDYMSGRHNKSLNLMYFDGHLENKPSNVAGPEITVNNYYQNFL